MSLSHQNSTTNPAHILQTFIEKKQHKHLSTLQILYQIYLNGANCNATIFNKAKYFVSFNYLLDWSCFWNIKSNHLVRSRIGGKTLWICVYFIDHNTWEANWMYNYSFHCCSRSGNHHHRNIPISWNPFNKM